MSVARKDRDGVRTACSEGKVEDGRKRDAIVRTGGVGASLPDEFAVWRSATCHAVDEVEEEEE